MSRLSRPLGLAALLALAASACVVACSGNDPASSAGDRTAQLQRNTGSEWIVDYDATGNAVLAFPKEPTNQVLSAGQDPSSAATAFLRQYPEVFGTFQDADLAVERVDADDDGAVHVLLTQFVGGQSVDDAPLGVHFDPSGGVNHVTGPFYPNLGTLVIAPAVTAEQAAQNAIASAQATGTTVVSGDAPTLAIRIEEGQAAYVYVVRLTVDEKGRELWIDPQTGKVVRDRSLTHDVVDASGQGVKLTRSFQVDDAKNGVYDLRLGATATTPLVTVTNNVTKKIVTTSDRNAWEPSPPANCSGLAVEAMYKMHAVLGWWKTVNGWSSYDNKGAKLDLLVYGGTRDDLTNALWDGEDKVIRIFPGDGKLPPSADIDTIGHEFTHAVVDYTAKLTGDCDSESGGMNEGLADVFGAFAERATVGGDPSLMGDEFDVNAAIRSYSDPHLRKGKPSTALDVGADHMSNRSGECHNGAGVVDLAWWLMTFGGPHPDPARKIAVTASPLGWETSLKLWWGTLRSNLRGASAYSYLARRMMLTARSQGLPLEAPGCAWAAVGALSTDELKSSFKVDCDAQGDAGTSSGDASAVDSCAGKSDGTYCSAIDSRAAYTCQKSGRTGGDFCPAGQKCTGPNGSGSLQCE